MRATPIWDAQDRVWGCGGAMVALAVVTTAVLVVGLNVEREGETYKLWRERNGDRLIGEGGNL